ncbi:MAG: hypothetical protein K2M86_05690 [Odoribacter sp.]|nr:hypothetical protein [Odoribacter sp.]
MRLLIAGILTLAIHLLVCIYDDPAKESAPLPGTSAPIFHLPIQTDFQTFHLPLYPFYAFFTVVPPLMHDTETQIFPRL